MQTFELEIHAEKRVPSFLKHPVCITKSVTYARMCIPLHGGVYV